MKYIFSLAIILCLIMSCKTQDRQNNIFNGKEYKHIYLFSSMANEYGKGGGKHYLSLSFHNDSVTLFNVKSRSLPNEKGEQIVVEDIEEVFISPYNASPNTIKIDNPILPQLAIRGDTLIAPQINYQAERAIFKDSMFLPSED